MEVQVWPVWHVFATLCLQSIGMIKEELEGCCMKTDGLLRDAAKTLAGTGEGSAHSGVGRFLQCPLRTLTGGTSRSKDFFSFCEHTLLHLKITKPGVVLGPASQSVSFLAHSQTCPQWQFGHWESRGLVDGGGCTSQGWLLFSSLSKIFLDKQNGLKESRQRGKRSF